MNTIEKITLDNTEIYICEIETDQYTSRHDAERVAVETLLGEAFGPDVTIEHDPNGAPILCGTDGYISVSHSRERVAIAFNPSEPIGVDIEEWRDQLQRVRDRFISPAEGAYDGHLLLHAWTAKEACYKACGTPGLSLTDIRLSDPDERAVIATIGDRSFEVEFFEVNSSLLAITKRV